MVALASIRGPVIISDHRHSDDTSYMGQDTERCQEWSQAEETKCWKGWVVALHTLKFLIYMSDKNFATWDHAPDIEQQTERISRQAAD